MRENGMDSQVIAAALATERKCYAALIEVMELTQDLSDAVQRQDQVTVQMFLSMRQEPINQLKEYRSLQRKRCASLPEEESAALWKVLTGKGADGTGQLQDLEKVVGQNQSLLERIQQADRHVSVRLGGKKSFYSK